MLRGHSRVTGKCGVLIYVILLFVVVFVVDVVFVDVVVIVVVGGGGDNGAIAGRGGNMLVSLLPLEVLVITYR